METTAAASKLGGVKEEAVGVRTKFLEGPCSPKWLLRGPLKSLCLRRFEIECLQAVDDIVHPPEVFFLFFTVRRVDHKHYVYSEYIPK